MNHTKFSQGPVSKQEWRVYLRQRASGVGDVSREVCQNIFELLTQLKSDSGSKEYWAAYMAMPKEISVESLLFRFGVGANKNQFVNHQTSVGDLDENSVSWVFPKVFCQGLDKGLAKKDSKDLGQEKAEFDLGKQLGKQLDEQGKPQMGVEKVKELRFFSPGFAGFTSGYAGILEPVTEGAGGAVQVSLAEVAGVLVPGLGFDKQGVRMGHGQGFYDRTLQGYPGLKIGVTCEALIVDRLPSESTDIGMDYLVTEKAIYKLGV